MKGPTLSVQRFLDLKNGPTVVDFGVLLALIVVLWLTASASLTHAATAF